MSVVRRAVVGDSEAMGALHVRAWQSAYAEVMPTRYLDALDAGERAAMWRRGIDAGTSDILVATDEAIDDAAGDVRGFACFGSERDDGVVGELYALNVDPAAWGRGHGQALLAAATASLAERWSAAVLWVVDANERAQRLYTHAGWRADGARRADDVMGAVVDELRFRRSLG